MGIEIVPYDNERGGQYIHAWIFVVLKWSRSAVCKSIVFIRFVIASLHFDIFEQFRPALSIVYSGINGKESISFPLRKETFDVATFDVASIVENNSHVSSSDEKLNP
jgi:hypothetical protein